MAQLSLVGILRQLQMFLYLTMQGQERGAHALVGFVSNAEGLENFTCLLCPKAAEDAALKQRLFVLATELIDA